MDSRLTIGITRMYDKPSSASRQATIAEMDGNSKLTCSTNAIALAITSMASVYTLPCAAHGEALTANFDLQSQC